jgi:hypothetical protein
MPTINSSEGDDSSGDDKGYWRRMRSGAQKSLADTKSLTATAAVTDSQEPPKHGRPKRLGWTKLLKRGKILNHLGLEAQPPARALATPKGFSPAYFGCEGGRLRSHFADVIAHISSHAIKSDAHFVT